MEQVGQVPASNDARIEQLRDAPAGSPQAIEREVLEEARDGKLAPEKIAGETYVRQQFAAAS